MKPSPPFYLRMQAITTLAACSVLATVAPALFAQPRDTVRINLSRPAIDASRITLWQNALYRWTLTGQGNIGTTFPQGPAQIDARFVLTNLRIPGLTFPAALPLSDNAAAGQQYCTQGESACNIFLASNARTVNGVKTLDPAFRFPDDVTMLKNTYKFIPDDDRYNAGNRYVSTVRGADVPAKFAFLSRYGEQSNTYYDGNKDGSGNPTIITAVIERVTPEVLVIERGKKDIVLNDVNPNTVFRVDTVDFGNVKVGSPVTITRVIKNRGLTPLQASVGADFYPAKFVFSAKFDNGIVSSKMLQRDTDEAIVSFSFTPSSINSFRDELVIVVNDSTQTPDGKGGYQFRFVLKGTGAPEAITPLRQDVIYSDLQLDQELRRTIPFPVTNNGSAPIVLQQVIQPQAPSAFRWDGNITLPRTISVGETIQLNLVFEPTAFGSYQDEIVLRGAGMADVSLNLSGTAFLARWSLVNPAGTQDTVDFGAVIPETASQPRSFTLKNDGNVRLFFQLRLAPSPNGTIADPTGFQGIQSQVVDTSYTLSPKYFAFPGTLQGRKEAFVTVQAFYASDRATPVGQPRRLVLVARVGSVLATERATTTNIDPLARERVRFDSIYVGQTTSETVTLRNIANQTITIDSQAFLPIVPFNGIDFSVDTLQRRVFSPLDASPVTLRYRPAARGFDSANMDIRFTSGGRSDRTTLTMSGIGVEQRLELVAAPPDPPYDYKAVIGDTVDIGDVIVNKPKTVAIKFRNNGNLPYSIQSQSPTDVTTGVWNNRIFEVVSRFSPGATSPDIPADGVDASLQARFTPPSVGEWIGKYTLTSTIRRRIRTAPDGSDQRVFFIRGRGVEPAIDVTPSAVTFDNIIFTAVCGNTATADFRVISSGSTELIVSSITVPRPPTGNSIFSLASGTPNSINLKPGASATIKLQFTPPSVGVFRDTVTIMSNVAGERAIIRVSLSGTSVARQSAELRTASLRAKPGTQVAVPITITTTTASALQQIQRATIRLSYEKTLLKYAAYENRGTASAAAAVTAKENNGVLDVTLQGMMPNGTETTLLTLFFDTYLGDKAATDIAFSNVQLGNKDCFDVLDVRTTNGTFALDSVCGLNVKTLTGTANVFALRPISPNPMASDGIVTYDIAFPTHVSIVLYDAQGTRKVVLAEGQHPTGVFETRIPLELLGSGMYFCEMRAGIFHEVQKLFIIK